MTERAHILVVDDNISLCKTMSLILGRKGYAVTTATDGLEAIDRVKERPFEITFTDIKMPLMDGVQTHRRIKEIRPEALVIMITGYAVEDMIQEALQEGAYAALHKPLNMDEVLRMVDEILEKKRTGDLTDTAPNVLETRGPESRWNSRKRK